MKVENDEIIKIIKEHYEKYHPDLVITSRIMNKLVEIVRQGLENTSDNRTLESVINPIVDFLEKDKILNFIGERQPNLAPIPKDVVSSIKEYFLENLPLYEICNIYRKSNHVEDGYLYCVTAIKHSGSYACWSSWNALRDVLNNGHYELPDEQSCIDILKDNFTDITDEPEKYGLLSNVYVNEHNEIRDVYADIQADITSNVVQFNTHRKGR